MTKCGEADTSLTKFPSVRLMAVTASSAPPRDLEARQRTNNTTDCSTISRDLSHSANINPG